MNIFQYINELGDLSIDPDGVNQLFKIINTRNNQTGIDLFTFILKTASDIEVISESLFDGQQEEDEEILQRHISLYFKLCVLIKYVYPIQEQVDKLVDNSLYQTPLKSKKVKDGKERKNYTQGA
jgi:hypothetical protein